MMTSQVLPHKRKEKRSEQHNRESVIAEKAAHKFLQKLRINNNHRFLRRIADADGKSGENADARRVRVETESQSGIELKTFARFVSHRAKRKNSLRLHVVLALSGKLSDYSEIVFKFTGNRKRGLTARSSTVSKLAPDV